MDYNKSSFEDGIPTAHLKNNNLKDKIFFPEELVDELAEAVAKKVENTMPVRRIRKSQVLTVLIGVVGFSLFSLAINQIFFEINPLTVLIAGIVLMLVSGISLRSLLKS